MLIAHPWRLSTSMLSENLIRVKIFGFLIKCQNPVIYFLNLNQVYQLTIYQDEDSDADSFDEDPEISLAVSTNFSCEAS